ncbi:MAG TPA: GNAT family N-acetyltransferase [Pirellulales bacterium]|jgi:CelD/BcsL family acetyltransferase involved in cellulose biosynthesis|nr:GNAT family N-acetyltransferase [Pirellulales bacterium]
MAAPRLVQFESVSALRDAAAAWDDLWQRSEVALPIGRAELVAQWIEAAAPRAGLRALAVEQDGQLVAAMPLLGGTIKRLIRVGRLPTNDWSWAGDLLVDPSADSDAAMELLALAVGRLPWRLLWLDGVAIESPRWMQFVAALESVGLAIDRREQFRVGTIEIDHDWPAYRASWSGNHRHQMRRMENRARREGSLSLTVLRDMRREQVEPLLRRGFEVECRGWKGTGGTAVLNSREMLGYYCRLARQLAEWGQLQLTFLELDGRPIAFEFGWNAKGVYCSPKVGYDEAFRQLTPGQLLRHELLERFFADPEQRLFDFVGPLAEATLKWITGSYKIGRLAVGTERRGGRAMVEMLRRYGKWKGGSKFRGGREPHIEECGDKSNFLASAAGSQRD